MASVNAQMTPQDLQQTMQQFSMESAKMDMTEEISQFSAPLSSIKIHHLYFLGQ